MDPRLHAVLATASANTFLARLHGTGSELSSGAAAAGAAVLLLLLLLSRRSEH
jgi:LPXTG-motif cell wall-anchored protein